MVKLILELNKILTRRLSVVYFIDSLNFSLSIMLTSLECSLFGVGNLSCIQSEFHKNRRQRE